MQQAIVERPMAQFNGRAVVRGEIIEADELSKLSPQSLRSLVENGYLRVDGMAAGPSSSVEQHLRARADQHDDRIKKLEDANAELASQNALLLNRVDELENKVEQLLPNLTPAKIVKGGKEK